MSNINHRVVKLHPTLLSFMLLGMCLGSTIAFYRQVVDSCEWAIGGGSRGQGKGGGGAGAGLVPVISIARLRNIVA